MITDEELLRRSASQLRGFTGACIDNIAKNALVYAAEILEGVARDIHKNMAQAEQERKAQEKQE